MVPSYPLIPHEHLTEGNSPQQYAMRHVRQNRPGMTRSSWRLRLDTRQAGSGRERHRGIPVLAS
jgi:hypothetical protein